LFYFCLQKTGSACYSGYNCRDYGLAELVARVAMESGHHYGINDVVEELVRHIERVEDNSNDYFYGPDLGIDVPQEEDFESIAEYENAMEEHQNKVGEIMRDSLPFTFTNKIYSELDKITQKKYKMSFWGWFEHQKGSDKNKERYRRAMEMQDNPNA